MIVIEELEQGSELWLELRKGRATASEAKKILTPTGKPSKSAVGYMRKLARECVIDDPQVFMGNKHTEWGHAHEPEAREKFIELTGLPIDEVGFALREDQLVGFSADGLQLNNEASKRIDVIPGKLDGGIYIPHENDYGLEIKCPQVDTHTDYVIEGVLPDDYKMQVHWSLAASGLSVWYFMSYFPGLTPLIVKVERDGFTEKVRAAQDQFLIDYAPERERVLNAILPSRQAREELVI